MGEQSEYFSDLSRRPFPMQGGSISEIISDMGRKHPPPHLDAGRRLKALRRYLGHEKMEDFGKDLGTTGSTYSKWEKGIILIPPRYARQIKERFGVSTDWLLWGDGAAHSPKLEKALHDAWKNSA